MVHLYDDKQFAKVKDVGMQIDTKFMQIGNICTILLGDDEPTSEWNNGIPTQNRSSWSSAKCGPRLSFLLLTPFRRRRLKISIHEYISFTRCWTWTVVDADSGVSNKPKHQKATGSRMMTKIPICTRKCEEFQTIIRYYLKQKAEADSTNEKIYIIYRH